MPRSPAQHSDDAGGLAFVETDGKTATGLAGYLEERGIKTVS